MKWREPFKPNLIQFNTYFHYIYCYSFCYGDFRICTMEGSVFYKAENAVFVFDSMCIWRKGFPTEKHKNHGPFVPI